MRNWQALMLGLALWLLAFPALAQDVEVLPDIPLEQQVGENGPPPDGWTFKLGPALSVSFNDNRNVVGQVDGYTLNLGLKFSADIVMIRGPHEWRNAFRLSETLSRTPLIDQFFLSEDNLDFETIYLYYLVDWFGFYGRATLAADVFPGYDYQVNPVTYVIDGVAEPSLSDTLRLSDFFDPLVLKQGIGPFFRPLKKEAINIEILLGLGFHESILDGVRTVTDDSATPEIEITTLQNVYQIGAEGIARAWGSLWDKKISYQAWVETLTPFYTKPDIGLRGGDIVNVEAGTRWSIHFFEWMSLDYEFKVVRQAQIVNKWQIMNNILFNLSYAWDYFKAWDGNAPAAAPEAELPAAAPADEAAPAEEAAPTEEAAPAEEAAPVDAGAPAEEAAPADEAAPAPEVTP